MNDTLHGFYLAIGKQGSGKTLFITKLMYDSLENRPVYSNYSLNGIPFQKITFDKERERLKLKENGLDDETIQIELDKMIDILEQLDKQPSFFNNSIMLLDEIHIYLDSLDFMKKNNRKLQVFFSQLRKRNILLLATTQYIMNVDIRIRRQCMNVFEMTNIKDGVFKVITHEIDGYYTEEISEKFLNLSEYFPLYNTNEIIL